MRRKGLPQASAAVRWSVTGSVSHPTGTKTTLWSVSISAPPGREGSAPTLFHAAHVYPKWLMPTVSPCPIGFFLVFMSSRQQLMYVALP